jgi:hypothetical protein
MPAWMTSHAEPVEALRGANREVGGGRHWAQKALVIAQAAVSLVLLSAAAMLGGSLRNLEHQNFGFDPDGRYLVSINSQSWRTISRNNWSRSFVRFRTGSAPFPECAASAPRPMRRCRRSVGPRHSDSGQTRARPEGRCVRRLDPHNAGFFDTIGASILAGRTINEDDNENTRHVAVINEAFAKKFFGNQNPIGRHFGPLR